MARSNVRPFLALSAALALAVISSCQNRPPAAPTVLAGSTYCLKDTACTFRTIVTDPNGFRVAVRVDWGDSTVSGWTTAVPSGDTISLTHVWKDTGTFGVSSQAEDEAQHRSGWSSPLAVRVVLRRPPDMPLVLVGPTQGGQDSSYTFATSASHPDGITVAIRFAWGDGDTSDWSAFVASGETVAMSHAWTAPGAYYVTAQARDTGTGRSIWSLPHSITIKPLDTLRIWRFQLGDSGVSSYSSPAIGPDGTIYVGSLDSSLYAVNSDGTLKWRYSTGGGVQSSPTIAPDGTIYVGSYDHRLYAVNLDGALKWSYLTAGSVRSSPAIAADGTVYVASDDNLYAINPDGILKWQYATDNGTTSSPAIAADGTVYFGSYDNHLYAVNPDGTLRWRYDVGNNINRASAAIGSDGTVYCGADANHATLQSFYALGPDGALKWSFSTGGDVRSSPVIAGDGTVYVGSGKDSLFALNPDGTVKWYYLTNGYTSYGSSAIAADGTVYFTSSEDFYALHSDGTLKWRYETGGYPHSSPAIGPDGTVYFTSSDGYLYALKGPSPLADSPWPKFHHDLRNTGRVGGGR